LFKPGNVTLGSSKNQSRRGINEVIRNVNISKHFYISDNLISEKLYSMYDEALSRSSNLPVNNISWIEAAKYCNWLSEKEGFAKFYQIESGNLISFNMKSKGYRLPTESEWEYVAKSNSDQELIYTWGVDRNLKSSVGNISDESASGIFENYIKNYDDGYDLRSPVGQFSANQNGLKDLTGNLSEWTNDFYSVEVVSPDSIFTNYMGPKYGSAHTIKGSNYSSSYPLQLGISYRAYGLDGDNVVGFRVARWIY
jgi:formylglycine-generating enzyme required for sulfatase activity